MRRFLLGLLALLATTSLAAAQAVQQSGAVTQGHVPAWVTNGIIRDGGTAANGNITSLGIVNNGVGFCQNSAAVTGPYNQFCISVGTAANARLSLQNFGGATAQGLEFVINGVTLALPAASGTAFVTTNTPSSIGSVLCFTSTAGLVGACGGIANSQLATAAAATLKGNPTGALATPTDFTIGSLPQKASPGANDFLILQDQSASGALKYATVSSIASAGSVSSFNGLTGAIVDWPWPQGRLTLTSGTPVMATSVAAATTVYYTAYAGKNIPIYNGTAVAVYQLCAANTAGACQVSVALGSNWATNTNYDWFIGLDSSTLRLCSGPAWTSSTGRGTGAATTELQQLDGLNTNKVSMTCRYANASTFTCPVNQCTYVGSMRTGSAGQTNFVYGAASSGGTAANLGLWNAYNRVQVKTVVSDSATYTYSSATTRPYNNSTGNRVSFISGLDEDGIDAQFYTTISFALAAGTFYLSSVALDATNTLDKFSTWLEAAASGGYVSPSLRNSYAPQLGFHFIQATETADGTNATTVNPGASAGATGLHFDFSM